MLKKNTYDAVVVGSGPNGLAAAITLAKAGLSVLICEAKNTIGGGMRTAELTLPGFKHDICSAIHPLGFASPFFSQLPLSSYGLEWIQPPSPLAHPFENKPSILLERSIDATASQLDTDSQAYTDLYQPLVQNWDKLKNELLGPLRFPKHPFLMARFGFLALQSAYGLATRKFKQQNTQALFAGMAAHCIMPLEQPVTAAIGLILGLLAHRTGWPLPRGGSQNIANALGAYFTGLGGEIATNMPIEKIHDLPPSKIVLFDISPKQMINIVGDKFPKCYTRRLQKYRYGPGVFKIDWALNAPIPWKDPNCSHAGTVHLGENLEEIAKSEREVWQGIHPEKPFVLLAQPSLFDPSRAPAGKHTAWAYCHVPNGSQRDMAKIIEKQVERYAPGFSKTILARSQMTAAEMEIYNPNYIGGDINGGVQDLWQLFTRPVARLVPYSTPVKGYYICSASTPPGGGVHGMCGHHAALAALRG